MVWVSCLSIDFSLGILMRQDLHVTSKNHEFHDYFFSYVLRLDINILKDGRNRYEKKKQTNLICTSMYELLDIQ